MIAWYWYPLIIFGSAIFLGFATAAGFDLIGKRRPLPPGHRRCHWCRYTGHPAAVLMHEVEEHRA